MEPLWSPVVATSRTRTQIAQPRERQRQAKTVAVGCDQLPATFHGKEGVSGSSPEEGGIGCPQCRGRGLPRTAARAPWLPSHLPAATAQPQLWQRDQAALPGKG